MAGRLAVPGAGMRVTIGGRRFRLSVPGRSWSPRDADRRTKLDEILNKEILVTGFRIKDSHQKTGTQYLTIHFEIENRRHITFTGSTVLMDQLKKYESHIPFVSTIKKINRHYTFS
jgi:hypothetical protein